MPSALAQQGVPFEYVDVLRRLYCDQQGVVRTDRLSRTFAIERGTKQGDPISPILFNAALEQVMRPLRQTWTERGWGVNLGAGTLTNLRFADDFLLVGGSLLQVTTMLSDLAEAAEWNAATTAKEPPAASCVAMTAKTAAAAVSCVAIMTATAAVALVRSGATSAAAAE